MHDCLKRSNVCMTVVVLLIASLAPAGSVSATTAPLQSQEISALIDPTTFAGTMIVATPTADVVVSVVAGDAEATARRIQTAVAEGGAESARELGSVMPPQTGCGDRQRSIAGMGTYIDSVDGCAVFGYDGYQRIYHWYNTTGNIGICASGRGYSGSIAKWYSVGCISGGSDYSASVPWGNVLAYTKMSAMATSTVTGGTYDWIT